MPLIPVISLLLVLYLSLLVTRIATIALTHTGMSRQSAQLQSRSAFTGCGFTTSESEEMVRHPVRRRILMWLMLFGHVGIVTALSSLVLSFIDIAKEQHHQLYTNLLVLFMGLLVLWFIASSKWIDRRLSYIIDWALKKYTDLDVRDYVHLFHLADDYKIAEIQIESDDWAAGKKLMETRLRDEGLLVLGVQRHDGRYLGAPKGDTVLVPADTLIVYGRKEHIDAFDKRKLGKQGDKEHEYAAREHNVKLNEEKREDAVILKEQVSIDNKNE